VIPLDRIIEAWLSASSAISKNRLSVSFSGVHVATVRSTEEEVRDISRNRTASPRVRRNSTSDRPRYQRPVGVDARRTRLSGISIDGEWPWSTRGERLESGIARYALSSALNWARALATLGATASSYCRMWFSVGTPAFANRTRGFARSPGGPYR
jgi:hypothetical protein